MPLLREQDLRETIPKAGSAQARTEELLAAYERRRAWLSVAELTQPAWIKREPDVRGAAGEIVPPDTPSSRPLVVTSTFFDPALPPDAIQLVTVPYDIEDRIKSTAINKEPNVYVPFRVLEQTGWRAVQK